MTGGGRARKRFGQHFLTAPEIIDRIVRAIAPRPGETLVEIGPGRGAITRPLAKSGATLHAIEYDRDLVPLLRADFAGDANVTIHEADALEFDYATVGRDLRIVGNLPYNISTPLLFRLIGFHEAVRDMHFMLQKEVVDRLTAPTRTKAYGRLTIMTGCRLEAEPLFDVPPSAFSPPPRVVSSVLRLTPRAGGGLRIDDEALLSRIVAAGFSQRRKTLRNALRGQVDPAMLEASGISPGARAEEIAIGEWVALANRLAATR